MKRSLILTFFLISGIYCFGQTGIPKAQSMFIYNFSRLIEWPAEDKQGDFIIGVLGSSDIFSELETFCNGKKVGTQGIIVKRFKDATELAKCHILFISYGKTSGLADILTKVGSNSTLLVGEKKGCVEGGAAICFVITEDKLKFELKTANASKAGLKVNSKLEEMAILVR
jgi:hypothetical protein